MEERFRNFAIVSMGFSVSGKNKIAIEESKFFFISWHYGNAFAGIAYFIFALKRYHGRHQPFWHLRLLLFLPSKWLSLTRLHVHVTCEETCQRSYCSGGFGDSGPPLCWPNGVIKWMLPSSRKPPSYKFQYTTTHRYIFIW